MIRNREKVENSLPIIKIALGQGRIIGELLQVIKEKPIRSVSKVIEEMKPKYMHDYIRRGGKWPSEPNRQQKRIDTEHSVVVEFCKAFDLISYQGKEVMVTFFGRKLLKSMEEYGTDSIFDSVLSDYLGKIMIFVDDKKWGIVDSLKKSPNGMTSVRLLKVLNKRGVGIDISSLERRLKEGLREKLREKWRSKYGNRHMDWMWMENKLKKELQIRTNERLADIVESILKLFKHVGVVVKDNNMWYLDSTRLENLQAIQYWNNIGAIRYEDFFVAMSASYKIWAAKLSTTDVPIPLIRNDLCWKFDIPWDFFDLIIQQAPLEYGRMVLSFSQSRFPKKWGIVKNNRNLYYLKVMHKQGD
jgi:hypothetical protein